jgi:hypothetical protein
MRPCVVGIGGAGGKILKQFLHNQDINLMVHQFGKPLAFGNVKGIWLESAVQDAEDQSFYGDITQGNYPGYLICHGLIDSSSGTNSYIMDTYGLNLKARGYDRRAEYLKYIFEIFDHDSALKAMSSKEFEGYENPLSDYIWKVGIKRFIDISIGKKAGNGNESGAKGPENNIPHNPSIYNGLMSTHWLGIIKGRQSSKLCDSILFLASLGGGTGTGFINPIASYARIENADFPIFVMGILTEKESDDRHAPEGKRDLGAIIAMVDLLTKEAGAGIDCLMLIDNQILVEKHKKDFPTIDGHIYNSLKPFLDIRDYPGYSLACDSQAIRGIIRKVGQNSSENQGDTKKKLFPPILIPCYHTKPDYVGDVNSLVEGALGRRGELFPLGKDGRLFPCDPNKADRALIFTRGFFSSEEILEAIQKRIDLPKDNINIYRKLGDSKNEDMLVLLRNPYGGTPGEHKLPGTFEWKLYDVISQAIEYIDKNQDNILEFDYKQVTKDNLREYFYGKDGLRDELIRSMERLENGDKPIFIRPLCIFSGTQSIITATSTQKPCKADSAKLGLGEDEVRKIVQEELLKLKQKS